MPADAALVTILVLAVFAFFAAVLVYVDMTSLPGGNRENR